MIRDGIILDRRKKGVPHLKARSNIKEMSFTSFCTLLDHINATGDYNYLKQIKDPYAMMLLLGVYEKVSLPNVLPNEAFFSKDLPCESVWNVLKDKDEGKLKSLMLKTNALGHHYLYFISEGKNLEGVTVKKLFRALSEIRQVRYNDLYHSWVLQPDPEAMGFAALSDYTNNDSVTAKQRVTPVVGRPIRMVHPNGGFYNIRYPCEVLPNFWNDGNRVQVHKEMDNVVCFNLRDEEVDIPLSLNVDKLRYNGVFEGVEYNNHFYFYDVICLEDVWFHNRPYKDRVQFLWRFGDMAIPTFTVYDLDELKNVKFFIKNELDVDIIVYNLNRVYCPISKDGVIDFSYGVVQAVVKGKIGTGQLSLKSSDGVVLFDFGGCIINKSEVGKVLDVTQDGHILRYRFDLKEAQPWDEIKFIWGIDEIDEVKSIRWRKLKK